MEKVDLSIIIISYNTKRITLDCLNSIFKSLKENNQFSFEVIVIDNASTDGSVDGLNELKNDGGENRIKVLANSKNLGYAKANNLAAKQAQGNYLLFLNSDTLVLDQAINKLYAYYQKNENRINFLGPRLFNQDMTPQASCGPFYRLPMVFAHLFLRGDYWGLTRYSPNQAKEVDWISGACILTKKDYFNRLGGFDEQIFMYMDEIDLLFRAKKEKMHVFYFPEAKFIHLGSASSGNRTYPILQVYRGLLYFYQKHYDPFSVFILKSMLELKALTGILIGKITHNHYLTNTYGQAYQVAKMA